MIRNDRLPTEFWREEMQDCYEEDMLPEMFEDFSMRTFYELTVCYDRIEDFGLFLKRIENIIDLAEQKIIYTKEELNTNLEYFQNLLKRLQEEVNQLPTA